MDATPDPDGARKAASITLESIRKQYPDGTVAVHSLDLHVQAGELVVLIGPSGCGKSTVLRMINQLIEPTAGRVLLDGVDVTHTDPVALRRQIGYVIQHVGLFPHQTVRANAGTVPRLLGWDRRRIAGRVDELLDLVGLPAGQYGNRYPSELSGGQRQRVGVARALAADPVVLLMDEPFSAVDPIARGRLQEEFLRLQQEVRKTIVLVTHDLDEAVRLGDRIALLSQGGRLEQYAEPARLLGEPASELVREFVGTDRGIRRLAVTPLTQDLLAGDAAGDGTRAAAGDGAAVRLGDDPAVPLGDDPAVPLGDDPAMRLGDDPAVTLGCSLYDALAAMLTAGTDTVRVTDAGGRTVGRLTRDALLGAPTGRP